MLQLFAAIKVVSYTRPDRFHGAHSTGIFRPVNRVDVAAQVRAFLEYLSAANEGAKMLSTHSFCGSNTGYISATRLPQRTRDGLVQNRQRRAAYPMRDSFGVDFRRELAAGAFV